MTAYHFFLYFALLNGVGLIVALLSRRESREGSFFLAGLIAAILYSMSMEFLTNTGSIQSYPYLIRTQLPAALLVPALMYLYVLALTTPNFAWQRKYWLHFIPFGIAVVRYAIKNLFWPEIFYAPPSAYGVEWYIVVIAAISIYVAYLLACIEQLKHFHSQLQHYFSELRHVRLHWLQYLLILLSIPWLLALVDVVTGPYLVVEHFATAAVALIILMMGVYGFRQSTIFSSDEEWGHPYEEHLKHALTDPEFNEGEGVFSLDELTQRKDELEQFVKEQKPYLKPQLRLVDLAHGLNLKAYQVSEILNRGLGTTFYEFINRHRVQEAEKRLLDPRYSHLSILGIANDSGFNSKSVFNESFRRATGMTPSAFRKSRPPLVAASHH